MGLGEFSSRLLQAAFVFLSANYLGAEGFGVLSSGLAYVGVFTFLTDFGVHQFSIREVSKSKKDAKSFFGHVFGLKIILNLVIYFFLVVLSIPLNFNVFFISFLAVSLVFDSFTYLFYSVFQAFENLKYVAACRILGSLTLLAVGALSYFFDFGIWGFASAYILFYGVSAALGLIILFTKFFTIFPKFSLSQMSYLVKSSYAFGLTLFLTSILLSFDVLAVSYLRGDVAAGVYAAASKVVFALMVFLTIFNQSFFPVLSRLHDSSKKFSKVFASFLTGILFIAIPMAVITSTNAKGIIGLFYSAEFINSSLVLSVLIWGLFFGFLATPFHRVLEAKGFQNIVAFSTFFAVVSNIILNIVFIQMWGFVGAAYATTASFFILFFLPAISCSSKRILPSFSKRNLLAIIIPLALLLFSLPNLSSVSFVLRVLMEGLVFSVSFILLGGVCFLFPPKEI